MAAVDQDRVMSVFAEAVELPAAQRAAFVDTACAGDAELRREVEELLTVAEPAAAAFDAASQRIVQPDPDRIGAYDIIEPIGEGGMAVVYRALQNRPVRRTVALKLVKLGMDTRQFVSRFESERQALAVMDHPNVARVYDAGSTDTGRPYFVMEYVPGEPLLDYCDGHNLDLRQRLELFVVVCEAVEHAHRKGIIHRDLKNSNVLVAEVDGRPVPKVIDFGVAKMMQQPLGERALRTEHGQLVGTPEYMSPEQAERGAAGDVDTRADVYSLGVLLYELIAGVHPIASDVLRTGSLEQIQRAIRDAETPRPSTRLSTLSGDDAARIAQRRRTAVPTLIRNLRSELEWIPLKAMRKDREQRYRSSSELADDVRNYLDGRPLIAGPESRAYRLSKFVRRNRAGVAASAAMVFLLLAGVFATTWQAVRANREAAAAKRQAGLAIAARNEAEQRRRETQEVADFQANMLREIDVQAMGRGIKQGMREQVRAAIARQYVGEYPHRRKPTDAEVERELAHYDERAAWAQPADVARRVLDDFVLARAGQTLEKEFVHQPLVQAEIKSAIGRAYGALGLYGKAEPHLRATLEMKRAALGAENDSVAHSLQDLASLLKDKGDSAAAEALYRESLAIYRKLHGEEHRYVAGSLDGLGRLLSDRGNPAAAEPLLRQALAMYRKLLGDEHDRVASGLNSVALVLYEKGDYDAAEPLFREALALHRKKHGDEHKFESAVLGNLGKLLRDKGSYAEAEAAMRQALALRRKLYGDEDPHVARYLNNLGSLLDAAGDDAQAEPILREALALHRKLLGDEHQEVATSLNNLASVLQDRADYDAAEALYRESLEIYRKLLGDENAYVAAVLNNLAAMLQDKGDYARSEPLFRETLAMRRTLLGEQHWKTLNTANHLAELLRVTSRPRQAITLLAPFEQAQRRVAAAGNRALLAACLTTLGRARVAAGEYEAAEANLIEAQTLLANAKEAKPRHHLDALAGLVELYDARHAADPAAGHDAHAARWRAQLHARGAATQPAPATQRARVAG